MRSALAARSERRQGYVFLSHTEDNSMAIEIGEKADSGFDDRIGMLKGCHRRIESFLGVLCAVAGRRG
jgi:hypothetical protein